jgi:hypothetical protein
LLCAVNGAGGSLNLKSGDQKTLTTDFQSIIIEWKSVVDICRRHYDGKIPDEWRRVNVTKVMLFSMPKTGGARNGETGDDKWGESR